MRFAVCYHFWPKYEVSRRCLFTLFYKKILRPLGAQAKWSANTKFFDRKKYYYVIFANIAQKFFMGLLFYIVRKKISNFLIFFVACDVGDFKAVDGDGSCTNCGTGSTTFTNASTICVCDAGYGGSVQNCSGINITQLRNSTPVYFSRTYANCTNLCVVISFK